MAKSSLMLVLAVSMFAGFAGVSTSQAAELPEGHFNGRTQCRFRGENVSCSCAVSFQRTPDGQLHIEASVEALENREPETENVTSQTLETKNHSIKIVGFDPTRHSPYQKLVTLHFRHDGTPKKIKFVNLDMSSMFWPQKFKSIECRGLHAVDGASVSSAE